MFPLIETIKVIDGIPQNLSYHQYRFEASYFKLYKELAHIRLADVIQVPEEHRKGLVKLRFLYNQSDCFCQYDLYQSKPVHTLKLVFDNAIDYSLKWVNRKQLEKLLQQKERADEILIVKNNRITDTSFTNIVFSDGKTWFTPQFPLLHGTERARLLDEKKIKVADIAPEALLDFKSFKLINAMLDFDTAEKLPIKNIIF